jgi:hypothetical protein
MTLYLCDARMVYTGRTVEYDPAGGGPLPARAVDVAPPAGIAQWAGNRWVVLPEYSPAPPEPLPPVPTYSKLKIVEVIDGMGKLDEFAALLLHAPTRIQMRWSAAGSLAGDDADLRQVIAMIADAWMLSPEQVAEILKQCEA